jgi:hypothetical protein
MGTKRSFLLAFMSCAWFRPSESSGILREMLIDASCIDKNTVRDTRPAAVMVQVVELVSARMRARDTSYTPE